MSPERNSCVKRLSAIFATINVVNEPCSRICIERACHSPTFRLRTISSAPVKMRATVTCPPHFGDVHQPAIVCDPLQEIAHFDIGVAVVAVLDLAAFPEQCIRLIEEEDDAALFFGVEQGRQIFFGFTNVFANERLQSNSRSSKVPTQGMTPKQLRAARGVEIGFTALNPRYEYAYYRQAQAVREMSGDDSCREFKPPDSRRRNPSRENKSSRMRLHLVCKCAEKLVSQERIAGAFEPQVSHQERKLAVEAVICERVSVGGSLLTGRNTGRMTI